MKNQFQKDTCIEAIKRVGNISVQTEAEKNKKIYARYNIGMD